MDLSQESVVVDTTLASGKVQEILEGTGLKTILRGHGSGGGNLALQFRTVNFLNLACILLVNCNHWLGHEYLLVCAPGPHNLII